jgi:hypothetical protein
LVGAGLPARADVADVHDEGERLAIHLLDHAVEPLGFGVAVGRIAQRAEDERARRNRRQRRARPEQKKKKQ